MGAAAIFKLMSIGVIVISIVIGLVFFYFTSELERDQKKIQLEEMVSQLINFVIFIWVGKIMMNFSIFIKDPLAILAYPSNSEAFYVAVSLSTILLFYKAKKKKFNVLQLVSSFLPVILVASFLYEFIQLVWNNNTYSIGNLALFTILLVFFLLAGDRMTSRKLMTMLLIGWSVGILLLAYIQPFATVFGYIMAPWFISLFLIINLLFITFVKRD